MKPIFRPLLLAAAAALACAGGAAQAQSNVTIYGLIDAGVNWTDDVASAGGKRTLNVDTGVAQGSRLGFKGTEDLGGGLKANFVLESGMNVDAGTLAQGGLMFGRQASVGLSGSLGSLQLGRMYDMLGDVFPAYALATNTPAGLMAWSLPTYSAGGRTLDNRVWGSAINNSVKYVSPKLGAFSFGATYALGEVAGASVAANSSYSAVATYAQGPFSASLASYFQHDASTTNGNLKEYALGAAYQMEKMRLFGMASQVGFSEGSKAKATTAEVGLSYALWPQLVLAGGVQVQKREDLASADQLTLTADYLLSKRSDVYLVVANARDRAYGAQVEAALGGVSSSTVQNGVRLGFRHKF